MIYLDAAATTFPSLDYHGQMWLNANTPYAIPAKEQLHQAEEDVKKALGLKSGKVVFGGNASVMFKYLFDKIDDAWAETLSEADEDESKEDKIKWHSLFSSPYEHECIANGEQGIHISSINELKAKDIVKDKMWHNRIPITFCQLVSNITGDIFPIEEIGKVARELNGFYVCDMTSAIGKTDIPENLEDFCDCIVFSAHKIHGLKGQGAIWVSDRFNEWLDGIEYIGTPDVDGACNTAYALKVTLERYKHRYPNEWDNSIRNALFNRGIKYQTMSLEGCEGYSDDIICLRINGVYADALQNFLASKKIFIGVGHSSCEDGDNRYRVLVNGGYPEKVARQCIRLSFDGWITPTTDTEIEELADAIKEYIDVYGLEEEEDEGN